MLLDQLKKFIRNCLQYRNQITNFVQLFEKAQCVYNELIFSMLQIF
jgi:hypothetical protein